MTAPPAPGAARARRPRKPAAERRAEILAAARRLFAERGFHATTTRDLAAAADINDALLYRYFANKEEILAGLLDQAVEVFRALPGPPAEAAELPLELLLQFAGEGFLQAARANLDLLTIMISENRTLAGDTRFVEFIDQAAARLGELIEAQGAPVGTGYLTARSFFGSLISFLLVQDVLGLDQVRQLDATLYLQHTAALTAAAVPGRRG
ncbi:helix-turn-helix domain-containing protein [Kitasatospora sp. LaBMicrA B282]|uniref:TetR/AcrR family transcriptional regulator n=1 Tax=Kitasatospora sp. LaBMicrA B282 TaxID=3420949 RepID=UPI003D1127D1